MMEKLSIIIGKSSLKSSSLSSASTDNQRITMNFLETQRDKHFHTEYVWILSPSHAGGSSDAWPKCHARPLNYALPLS